MTSIAAVAFVAFLLWLYIRGGEAADEDTRIDPARFKR